MKYSAEEQYQGMHRAFERMRALATDIGKTVVIGDHAAADATKAFFIECYHFKDYLKKETRIQPPSDVEVFISANPALSMAADLCNAFKHAGLDKPPRSGMHLDQINMAYSLDISATTEPGMISMTRIPSDGDTITISRSNRFGPPIATAKVVLTVGGNKHDALKAATQCIADWDRFLASKSVHFATS
jgi:hypothetical protein